LGWLHEITSELPTVPDSILLGTEAEIVRSRIPKCATVVVRQLYGTNDYSLEEVIELYEDSLDKTVWLVSHIDTDVATFRSQEYGFLGVSDNYVWYPGLQDAVSLGQKQYETLYLVTLTAFVEPATTKDECT